MVRFSILFAIIAAPALAQDKEALCENSARVVNAVVLERAAGASKKKAVRRVVRSLEGDLALFKEAVPPLADWVYTLPEEQLTDEPAAAYKATCLAN